MTRLPQFLRLVGQVLTDLVGILLFVGIVLVILWAGQLLAWAAGVGP